MSSAGSSGISRYRARRRGIKTSRYGRDGGGKIMKRRAAWWECNGVVVHGPSGKSKEGWVNTTP